MEVDEGKSSTSIVPINQQVSDSGAAMEFSAPDGMEVGSRIEGEMTEEGLQGARFSGEVVAVDQKRGAKVRIDAWGDEEPDWIAWHLLRPHPPSPPGGETWVNAVKKGDHVDMFHEEAWWEMEVREVEHEPGDERAPRERDRDLCRTGRRARNELGTYPIREGAARREFELRGGAPTGRASPEWRKYGVGSAHASRTTAIHDQPQKKESAHVKK